MSNSDPHLKTQKLAIEALKEGKVTDWFESVYQIANGDPQQIPWAKLEPNSLLRDWLETTKPEGKGKKALVIGCGLGDDAEILTQLGFSVTAFDVAETAIAWCRQRFPQSEVNYLVADLFNLPETWDNYFDLVVEIRTIQSLPVENRDSVLKAIANLIKSQGILFLVTNLRTETEPLQGPTWAMSFSEVQKLETLNLTKLEQVEIPSLIRVLLQKNI
jgi:2-polyprenyl-3-methyl-5-hydroxy-6-metoxy-1,4-benzoquinol methylase